MDAKLALQVLRKRALYNLGVEFNAEKSSLFNLIHRNFRALPKNEFAIANPATLTHRLNAIQSQHDIDDVQIIEQNPQTEEKPTLLTFDDLHKHVDIVVDLLQHNALSKIENQVLTTHQKLLVSALAHKTLDVLHPVKSWEDVRNLLLELTVNPVLSSRRFAFVLLFNLSIETQANRISTTSTTSDLENTQNSLFTLLVEMLEKLIVIDTTTASSDDTTARSEAVGCLLYFLSSQNVIFADRLILVDPHILVSLLSTVNEILDPDVEYRLFELVVASMYLRQLCEEDDGTHTRYESRKKNKMHKRSATLSDDTKMKTLLPSLSGQMSTMAYRKMRGTALASSLKFHLQFPTDEEKSPIFKLKPSSLQHYGGLDSFIQRLQHSESLRVQRLAFMVLYDVARHQVQRQPSASKFKLSDVVSYNKKSEKILKILNSMDTAYLLRTNPHIKDRIPKLIHKVYAKKKSGDDSFSTATAQDVIEVLNELGNLIKIEEYYGQSASLQSTVNMLQQEYHTKQRSTEDDESAILNKVCTYINSQTRDEVYKGERWLAELLLQTDDSNDSAKSSVTARNKLWELAKATDEATRMSFVRVLTYYTRRRMSDAAADPAALSSLLSEVSTALCRVVRFKESSVKVLCSLLNLVLELCARPYSYFHQKHLRLNTGPSGDIPFYQPTALRSTDTLAALLLSGKAAVGSSLVSSISPKFFVHVLLTLSNETHPSVPSCVGTCCGITSNHPGDVMTCCIYIIQQLASFDNSIFSSDLGGIEFVAPFIESCDIRVAMFASSMIIKHIREVDLSQYQTALCDMLVSAQASGDEKSLDNPFLQCKTMLTNYWRTNVVSPGGGGGSAA